MAHLVYIRETVSFVEGPGLTYGTHEIMEREINKRKYPMVGRREGYNIPAGSEFKLGWYRVKKEAIPKFILDLAATNLNPKTLPKGFWLSLLLPNKLAVKFKLIPEHWKIGRAMQLSMLFLRCVPFLKPYDGAKETDTCKQEPFTQGKWQYTFILGVIEDMDKGEGSGEEL